MITRKSIHDAAKNEFSLSCGSKNWENVAKIRCCPRHVKARPAQQRKICTSRSKHKSTVVVLSVLFAGSLLATQRENWKIESQILKSCPVRSYLFCREAKPPCDVIVSAQRNPKTNVENLICAAQPKRKDAVSQWFHLAKYCRALVVRSHFF
jgi:hypothetical protein